MLGPWNRRAVSVLAMTLLVPALARGEDDTSSETKPGYAQLLATAFVGDGLRFNNPYRLATPLGSSAESVSRSSTYVDIGAAAMLGNPLGVLHGLAVRGSFAVEGVRQAVLVPAYVGWKRWRTWAVYGRAGVPFVASPEATWGLELGAGGVWFARAGIGVAAELVGDVFYGAGTREVARPAYPVLSAQLGLVLAYEVLP